MDLHYERQTDLPSRIRSEDRQTFFAGPEEDLQLLSHPLQRLMSDSLKHSQSQDTHLL
jgi:hypothetical protein